jgi:hypothetical protein
VGTWGLQGKMSSGGEGSARCEWLQAIVPLPMRMLGAPTGMPGFSSFGHPNHPHNCRWKGCFVRPVPCALSVFCL